MSGKRNGRRNLIIEKSMELIGCGDKKKFNIRTLAKACGMKPSAIYNYFESKNDLIDSIKACLFDRMTRTFLVALEKNNASVKDDPEEELLRGLTIYVLSLGRDTSSCRLLRRCVKGDSLGGQKREWEKTFEEYCRLSELTALRYGLFGDDAQMAACQLLALATGMAMLWNAGAIEFPGESRRQIYHHFKMVIFPLVFFRTGEAPDAAYQNT
ncbi:MAG: TetR/AcrR family transcriptional regulator [Oscillospiraceae bacterium]